MGSTDAERQRRHRAHKSGRHHLCDPSRCEALRPAEAVPEPGPDKGSPVTPPPRDIEAGLISEAIEAALADAGLLPRDQVAVALVRRYIQVIDSGDADTVDAVGPKLLRALESLGMTPGGRGKGVGGGAAAAAAGKLDELRQRREERKRRAAGAGAD